MCSCARVVEWVGETVEYIENYDPDCHDYIKLKQGIEVHDKLKIYHPAVLTTMRSCAKELLSGG